MGLIGGRVDYINRYQLLQSRFTEPEVAQTPGKEQPYSGYRGCDRVQQERDRAFAKLRELGIDPTQL